MRIAIIGNAGGGKSRLGRALANRHDLPLLELDTLLWKPGWVAAPPAEIASAHKDWLAKPAWIIDGVGPWALAAERLAIADLVIFVDLPFATHVRWASKRQVASVFSARADGPPGCPMWKMTFRLYQMMWWFHRSLRPEIRSELARPIPHRQVITVTSVKALNDVITADREKLGGL